MKKVFLVLVMFGLLVSCSSGITQYATTYVANNITVSGDRSCSKYKPLFSVSGISIFEYNNKYMSDFTLIARKPFTTNAFVSLSGNNLFIWIKDRSLINHEGVDVRGTFNTNFNLTTYKLPNTISFSWDVYFDGHPSCHYEVTASKDESGTQVYTKKSSREVYEAVKSAFKNYPPDYVAKK